MVSRYRFALTGAVCALAFASSIAQGANDPASFGRSVKYLDVSTQPFGMLWFDVETNSCIGLGGYKCVLIPALAENTIVNEVDIARINLPAYASNSLLCASISPTMTISFANTTTSNRRVEAMIWIDGTIKSAALNNPALINKATGQPFNGKIQVQGITRVYESFTLLPQDFLERDIAYTRHCVGGLLSTKTLKDVYGLSDYQARSVFSNAMTVTLSARGTINGVGLMYMTIPFRLYGD